MEKKIYWCITSVVMYRLIPTSFEWCKFTRIFLEAPWCREPRCGFQSVSKAQGTKMIDRKRNDIFWPAVRFSYGDVCLSLSALQEPFRQSCTDKHESTLMWKESFSEKLKKQSYGLVLSRKVYCILFRLFKIQSC